MIRGEIENTDLSHEKEILELRRKTLVEEQQEIRDEFPFSSFKRQVQTMGDRLRKLEEKKKDISPRTYESLFLEYDRERSIANENLKKEENRLREIQAKAQDFVERFDETREEIQLRGNLGEFGQDDFKNRLHDLEIKRVRALDLLKALEAILG